MVKVQAVQLVIIEVCQGPGQPDRGIGVIDNIFVKWICICRYIYPGNVVNFGMGLFPTLWSTRTPSASF